MPSLPKYPSTHLSTLGSTGSSYLNNSRIKWTVIIGFIWFGFFYYCPKSMHIIAFRWLSMIFLLLCRIFFQPPDTIKANISQEPLSVVSGFLDHALVSVVSTVCCFCIVLYTTIINRKSPDNYYFRILQLQISHNFMILTFKLKTVVPCYEPRFNNIH